MTRLLFDYYVVLMLENRSFDHIFGYLGIGDGIPTGGATNYLKPGDATSEKFISRKGGDYTAIGEGPSHSLKQTNEQLFGLTAPSAAGFMLWAESVIGTSLVGVRVASPRRGSAGRGRSQCARRNWRKFKLNQQGSSPGSAGEAAKV